MHNCVQPGLERLGFLEKLLGFHFFYIFYFFGLGFSYLVYRKKRTQKKILLVTSYTHHSPCYISFSIN